MKAPQPPRKPRRLTPGNKSGAANKIGSTGKASTANKAHFSDRLSSGNLASAPGQGGEINPPEPPELYPDTVPTAPLPKSSENLYIDAEDSYLTSSVVEEESLAGQDMFARRDELAKQDNLVKKGPLAKQNTPAERKNFAVAVGKRLEKLSFPRSLRRAQSADTEPQQGKDLQQGTDSQQGRAKKLARKEVGETSGKVFQQVTSSLRKGAQKIALPLRGTERKTASPDIVSLAARRAERKADRRRKYLRRIGIGVGVALFALLLVWILFFSPLLRLNPQKVEITGVEDGSLIKVAQVQEVVEKHKGDSLLLISHSGLKADLEKLPEVDKAQLKASLRGNLKIALQSEVPAFCLVNGNECKAVSRSGQTLDLPPNILDTLPHLGPLPADVEKEAAVEAARQVVADLGDLHGKVRTIEISSGYQIAFTLDDSRRVIWGKSDEGQLKAQILRVLLGENKQLIDVSIPASPVTQ